MRTGLHMVCGRRIGSHPATNTLVDAIFDGDRVRCHPHFRLGKPGIGLADQCLIAWNFPTVPDRVDVIVADLALAREMGKGGAHLGQGNSQRDSRRFRIEGGRSGAEQRFGDFRCHLA